MEATSSASLHFWLKSHISCPGSVLLQAQADLAQASSALTEQDAGSLHLTRSDQICSDRVRNRLPASGSVTADEA